MKKIITIIALLWGISNSILADENKVPMGFDHQNYKMGDTPGNEYKPYYFMKQKYYNYKGTVYLLESKETKFISTYATSSSYIISISTYINNSIDTIYNKNNIQIEPNIFGYNNSAVFFGYGEFLWYFNTTGTSLEINRFNPDSCIMNTFKTNLPYTDKSYKYSASCVMDTCVYTFRSNGKSIMVDVFNFDDRTKQMVFNETFTLESSAGNSKVTSAECFLDTDNKLKLIYTTMNGSVGKASFYNPATRKVSLIFNKSDLGNMKVAMGSLQCDKEVAAVDNSAPTGSNPNRFSLFFVKDDVDKKKTDKSQKYYKHNALGFIEYVFDNEKATRLDTKNEYRVVLASSDYYAKGGARIDLTYYTKPINVTSFINGNDGYQKQILLINNDKNNQTNFSYFNSDIYRIVPTSVPAVTDFSQYTNKYYKDFWSLVGIYDGAPPAPVDWDLWESSHALEFDPSRIEISKTSSVGTSVTQTTKTSHSYGIGFTNKFASIYGAIGGFSMNDADINGSLTRFDSTFTVTITHTTPLKKDNQNYGYYIYLAPIIKRFEYNLYCWWDTGHKHPIKSTSDYMFQVSNVREILEPIPLNSGIFQISNPNDSSMAEWKVRGDPNPMGTMANHAKKQGLFPLAMSWNASEGPANTSISAETAFTKEIETTTQSIVDWSLEISGEIPEPEIFVFSGEIENSTETSFSATTTSTLAMSNDISFTYEHASPAVGLMSNALRLDVYVFTPGRAEKTNDWWYYDSLPNGFKPWYIAYGVTTHSASKFNLNFPAQNQQFISGEPLDFHWDGEFTEIELFVSTSPSIRPENTVRRIKTGTSLKAGINGLEPGKYYWAVSGKDADGILVYSESSSFEVLPKEFFKPSETSKSYHNTIPVLIYPNPAANNSTHVSYQTQQTGSVHLQLYTVQGQLVWEKSINHQVEGIYNEEIPLNNMGQIGIFVIDTPNGRGVQKILKQ